MYVIKGSLEKLPQYNIAAGHLWWMNIAEKAVMPVTTKVQASICRLNLCCGSKAQNAPLKIRNAKCNSDF